MAWKPGRSRCAAIVLGILVAAGCQGPQAPPLDERPPLYLLGPAGSGNYALAGGQAIAGQGQVQSQTTQSPIQQVAATQMAGDAKSAPFLPPLQPDLQPVPPAAAPFVLTLPEAIETGLTRNPDLITQRQAENVGQAIVRVARTPLYNPTVQVRILPYNKFANNTDAATYNYVLLWQQFEIAQQRRFRTQNAAAALNSTRWTIQQAEVQNVALTEQLYFTALYQRGLRDLADMTARVNDSLLIVM